MTCKIPPTGWACSRKAGHDGPCAATPLLTAEQHKAFYRALFTDGITPHCDQDVLHAPGECKYCDDYGSIAQAFRVEMQIDFTGKTTEGFMPCPSDARRGVGGAHIWAGNKPK